MDLVKICQVNNCHVFIKRLNKRFCFFTSKHVLVAFKVYFSYVYYIYADNSAALCTLQRCSRCCREV